jgi:predicted nucleotidyltransferase
MNMAHPFSAVAPSLDGEVLQVLAGTTMVMTGRQVAQLTGRTSHSGVLDTLHRLSEQGVVDRVELGRAFLFSLNRDHLAAPAVLALAGLRAELVARLRREIAAWEIPPVHASLFGSTARGDGDTHSDIDLLVIRPATIAEDTGPWRAQLGDLTDKIERWTGNRASLVEVTETEIPRLLADRPMIVESLRLDAIVLSGPPADAMLGD